VTVNGADQGFAFPTELIGKLEAANAKSGNLTLGIRPEGVLVERQPKDGFLPVTVHIIEPLGAYDIVDLSVGSHMLLARTRSGYAGKAGDKVYARIDPAQAHFFDTAGGQSLGVRL
jgi:multiple sugar transport system ATP-binding protein